MAGFEVVARRRSRSAPRAGRPRPPCPAARSRRWPRRSGSRADGRRCRAPSRPCAAASAARSGCAPPCPRRPAWCRRRACRRGPRSRPGRGGRSRTPPACRWRRASGSSCPARLAARMIEVPAGTVTAAPSMVSVTVFAAVEARRAVVDFVDQRHDVVLFSGCRRCGVRRNPRGNGVSALITG